MSTKDPHSDRRLFPRLQAPLYARPARLRRGARQQVLDVSLGGARIYSDDHHLEGSQLELDLFLRDGSSLTCSARVVWEKPLPANGVARYEVGLAFTDISDEAMERLKTVLVPEEPGIQ